MSLLALLTWASQAHAEPAGATPTSTRTLEPTKSQVAAEKQAATDEVVVRAAKDSAGAGTSTVRLDETARGTPGAMGDALVVVQSLPGVARPQAGSSDIIVWGAAPRETRIYVDDVPIPYLYHRGGLRSVLSADLVSSLELQPAGYGAAYGRATGGLLRLKTSFLPKEGLRGHASVDPLDASASMKFRQRETQGPWAFAAAGRYGWLDRTLPLVRRDVSFPLSSYTDFSAKAVHSGEDGTTELLVMGALDRTDRQVPEARSTRARTQRTNDGFVRMALRRTVGAASALVWVGRDAEVSSLNFGGPRAQVRAEHLRAGVRVTRTARFHKRVKGTLGIDAEVSRSDLDRTGTMSLPAREGDLVIFGQPPSRRVGTDAWVNHFVGASPFAELAVRPTRRWTLKGGLRLETMAFEGTRLLPPGPGGVDVGYSRFEVFVDPRLSAEYQASRRVSLRAAAGQYHQPPSPLDMSATFGSPALIPSRGSHALTGVTWKAVQWLRLEWSVFAKTTDALAMRSPLESPPLAQSLLATGEGRAVGGQAVARVHAGKKLSGWLSYTASRSERRQDPSAAWRKFDFDQPHAVTAVAQLNPTDHWGFGARLRATSGYPRARVVAAAYDAREGAFQPLRMGRERLPPFVQLDVHAERRGRWGPVRWVLYLDVINVTARKNAEEVVYSHDYRERSFLTGFPFLALLGARVER